MRIRSFVFLFQILSCAQKWHEISKMKKIEISILDAPQISGKHLSIVLLFFRFLRNDSVDLAFSFLFWLNYNFSLIDKL
jgi:hypothetical protein